MRKLSLQELGRVDIETYKTLPKSPVVVILDNIRSAHNVGSFFRTCDAFLIQHIYLCGITAQPPHREITKTAIGATASVDWTYSEDITGVITDLKTQDFEIIGIEQTDSSIPLSEMLIDADKKYAIIFGNEVQGISESTLPIIDQAVEIPQYGTKHSLNVSVCGGIVLWDFVRARKHLNQ